MSALPPKADMAQHDGDVHFGHSGTMLCSKKRLIQSTRQCASSVGGLSARCPCGLAVDHQLVLGRTD